MAVCSGRRMMISSRLFRWMWAGRSVERAGYMMIYQITQI